MANDGRSFSRIEILLGESYIVIHNIKILGRLYSLGLKDVAWLD